MRNIPADPVQPSEQGHSSPVEIVQADRRSAVAAGQVRVSVEAPLRCIEHVWRPLEQAHLALPVEAVLAAIAARQPRVMADGERHLTPCAPQLVGELDAGRGGADDEHAEDRPEQRVMPRQQP